MRRFGFIAVLLAVLARPSFATWTDSIPLPATSWEVDRATNGCALPREMQLGSDGPKAALVFCRGGSFEGHVKLPASYDGGVVRFVASAVPTTITTGTLAGKVECQCINSGDVVGSSWGTAQTWTFTLSSAAAWSQQETSAPDNTCSGTCQAGSTVYYRGRVTDPLPSVGFLGLRMDYTRN